MGIAIAFFSRVGVAIPLTDTQKYDLIIEDSDGLHRVQVRTTTLRDRYGVYIVSLETSGSNRNRIKVQPFKPTDYEWLFVVCGDACAYLIPTSEITVRTSLYLGRKYERFRLDD